jgi:hypothetical protein
MIQTKITRHGTNYELILIAGYAPYANKKVWEWSKKNRHRESMVLDPENNGNLCLYAEVGQ